ncbi:MAG: GIY-YIG nuclease family protein [Alphaproteobacteria bacterium]|nr:GIY-YIG nuclease family protein [Alphaproteobacteria bacterium]
MKQMYVYIMTNKNNTTLYVGVTNDLVRRVYEHKNHLIDGFTNRYNLTKLVYYEVIDGEEQAIQREKDLKKFFKDYKRRIITEFNPQWNDLYSQISGGDY